jgi:hypothetical protein
MTALLRLRLLFSTDFGNANILIILSESRENRSKLLRHVADAGLNMSAYQAGIWLGQTIRATPVSRGALG